jgi:hypothetical protein
MERKTGNKRKTDKKVGKKGNTKRQKVIQKEEAFSKIISRRTIEPSRQSFLIVYDEL